MRLQQSQYYCPVVARGQNKLFSPFGIWDRATEIYKADRTTEIYRAVTGTGLIVSLET